MLLPLLISVGSGIGNVVGAYSTLRFGAAHRSLQASWAGLSRPGKFALLAYALNALVLLDYAGLLLAAHLRTLPVPTPLLHPTGVKATENALGRARGVSVSSALGVAAFAATTLHLLLSPQVEDTLGEGSVVYSWLLLIIIASLFCLLSIYEAVIIPTHHEALELIARIAFFSVLVSMLCYALASWVLTWIHWRRYGALRAQRLAEYPLPKVFLTMIGEHRKFVQYFYTSILLSALWLPYVLDLMCFRSGEQAEGWVEKLELASSVQVAVTCIHPILALWNSPKMWTRRAPKTTNDYAPPPTGVYSLDWGREGPYQAVDDPHYQSAESQA